VRLGDAVPKVVKPGHTSLSASREWREGEPVGVRHVGNSFALKEASLILGNGKAFVSVGCFVGFTTYSEYSGIERVWSCVSGLEDSTQVQCRTRARGGGDVPAEKRVRGRALATPHPVGLQLVIFAE
jgi:hypothetical protein